MGLDWIPIAPKKDNVPEAVYSACKKMRNEADKKVNNLWEKLEKRFGEEKVKEFYSAVSDAQKYKEKLNEMTKSKVEALSVPRVGYDNEATDFIIKHRQKQLKEIEKAKKKGMNNKEFADYWSRPEAEVLADEWGKPISDLIKSDGLGAITGMMLVGADSFRGKCLRENPCIPEDYSIYEDMTSSQMSELADAMETQGKLYAKEKKLDWDKEGMNKKNCDKEDEHWEIYIAYQAVKWLRFWASKGFSLHAWY